MTNRQLIEMCILICHTQSYDEELKDKMLEAIDIVKKISDERLDAICLKKRIF